MAIALAFVLVACRRDAAKPAPRVVSHQDAKSALPSAPALPAEPVAPRGKQLTIVYSSNLLGEYEPCG